MTSVTTRGHILVVDDEPRMRQALRLLLEKWGYRFDGASNAEEALQWLDVNSTDLVLTDLKMPGLQGDGLLRAVRQKLPNLPIIIMTAFGSIKSAVAAMREGAYDYITKPFDNEELRLTIERGIEYYHLVRDNQVMRSELAQQYAPFNIIGSSAAMAKVLELVERVAPVRATVLITGESGTGKELVARAIHYASPRANKRFVAVNCAALTETLLESELFGHERGSFTGADRSHRGKFETADGGTLFLDEIGEMTNNFQTKLLRVLQEEEVTRVGANTSIKVDVRVIAATNRDLAQRVREGKFREDLFYRLNVVPIHLPPLRERPGDLVELANFFARRTASDNNLPFKPISQGAMQRILTHEWKGNVRELENTIERAVILSPGTEIEEEDLLLPTARGTAPSSRDDESGVPGIPRPGAGATAPAGSSGAGEVLTENLGEYVQEMTRRHVLRTLEKRNWRKQEAAEALGVDRATLYRIIKRYGIDNQTRGGD